MSSIICFVNWRDPNVDKYQHQQVALVKLYEDGERVEILYKRELLTVSKKDVEFARWE